MKMEAAGIILVWAQSQHWIIKALITTVVIIPAGLLLWFLWQSPPSPSDKASNTATLIPAAPAPAAQQQLEKKEFTTRSLRELFALYAGRTPFQADRLIEPYKGLWIEVSGSVVNIIADGQPGHSILVLRSEGNLIECRLDDRWAKPIARLDIGNETKAIGKIGPLQNGQQLYLQSCELL